MSGAEPELRMLLVNENLGGHSALHRYVAGALGSHPTVAAEIVSVPPPGILRRVLSGSVPGLGRLDLDLQPLRYQLAASEIARRMVLPRVGHAEALQVYSQNVALRWPGTVASMPSVVATDGTNEQNALTLPYRRPTRWTPATVRLTRRFEQRVYDAATLIVAQSSWAAASLQTDYGVDRERIRIIRFGIPIGPAPERVVTDLPEVAFVATSMERKGGFALLAAFRRVLRGRAVLHLVTPLRVPPESGVVVHNDVRPGDGKLASILARSAVFAFPSAIDKSSFAVMEAMAAGVPVIVTRTGGLPELVEDGVSGVVIDDVEDGLDAALLSLIEDRARTEAMGERARMRAAAEFDVERTTAEMFDTLREAMHLFRGEERGPR